MNIAILAPEIMPYSIGGTEKQFAEMAEELSKKHRVVVLTRGIQKQASTKKKYTIQISKYYKNKIINRINYTLESIKAVKKNKFDLLITESRYTSNIIGAVAYTFMKCPVINCVQGQGFYKNKSKLTHILNQYILNNCSLVLVQTDTIMKELKKKYHVKNMAVIPNGIHLSNNISHGKKILFIGRLVPEKGVTYLIDAVKDIEQEVNIFGTGPEYKNLKNQANTNKKVKFCGKFPNSKINTILKDGRVLVLPSISEGLPNVILEAMNLGVPVIATKVGGIPDIIKTGQNGILVEPENANKLKEAITTLMNNEKIRNKMSKNCKKEIKKYSWGKIIQQIEKTIEKTTEK
jgi:glycosyltransferase involved in cell wall biosynthesis